MSIHRSRRRPARRLAVAVLAAAAVVGAPGAALADDGDRILELSEGGRDTVVEVHFDGIVPGDSEEFTVDVRNAGPTAGVLVVDLPRPTLSGDTSRRFFDELLIEGPHLERVAVGDLTAPHTLLLAERLTPGQQVSVPLRFELPFDTSVGGNAALEGEHVVDLDLRAQIVGEDEAPALLGDVQQAGSDTGAGPGAGDGATWGGGARADTGGSSWLPRTGADFVLLALAAGITGIGLTLWALATRREEQEEDQ